MNDFTVTIKGPSKFEWDCLLARWDITFARVERLKRIDNLWLLILEFFE